MGSVVRIVKREERERANNSSSADSDRVAHRNTHEMIVKSWIVASRERRRAEAADYRRNFFRQWNEKQLCISRLQRTILEATPTTVLPRALVGVEVPTSEPLSDAGFLKGSERPVLQVQGDHKTGRADVVRRSELPMPDAKEIATAEMARRRRELGELTLEQKIAIESLLMSTVIRISELVGNSLDMLAQQFTSTKKALIT